MALQARLPRTYTAHRCRSLAGLWGSCHAVAWPLDNSLSSKSRVAGARTSERSSPPSRSRCTCSGPTAVAPAFCGLAAMLATDATFEPVLRRCLFSPPRLVA
eukprot:scaffold58648_cov24-Tisochrysis_lutea.AAC.2